MSGSVPGPRPDLAARVHEMVFTPVRLREGYAMDDVDQLLDDVADALSTGRPVRPLVDAARFAPTKLREGYAMDEVDRFLAELVASAEGAAPALDPSVPPAPSVLPPLSSKSAPAARTPSTPSVIEERRGLLDRLFRRQ